MPKPTKERRQDRGGRRSGFRGAECLFRAAPGGAAGSDFGLTLDRIIAPLGANLDRRPALGGGDDIRELQKAGVPVVSLRQDGLDYFDAHHTADDTLDKIDPKQLNQAVAVWSVFTYLAAASDVDFRSLTARRNKRRAGARVVEVVSHQPSRNARYIIWKRAPYGHPITRWRDLFPTSSFRTRRPFAIGGSQTSKLHR